MRLSPVIKICAFIYITICTAIAIAEPVYIGSFNINSGRATPSIIVKQMLEHEKIDIWGISESSDNWPAKILKELNSNKQFAVIKGSTGAETNRLQVFYNTKKFNLISHIELNYINPNNRVRSPLVAEFVDIKTNQQFLFMVNHLYRKDSDERVAQAKKINQWTRKQDLPVIAVGDYNFDLSPDDTSKHGKGFDELIKDNIYVWIEPSELIPTQCSKFNSILDFIFISNKVNFSNTNSKISYSNKDYCNNNQYSDHRPVTAMIDFL